MFQTIFYQPIYNLLIFLYNVVPGHDLGVVIIIITVLIKLILLPLSKQSIKSQKALQELQPKIDALKKKHANNKEELGRATMEMYKENKVNPFSSCLPLIIQLPFLFAVFQVFRDGLKDNSFSLVYSFIEKPEALNHIAFGFLNLAEPNYYLAIASGAAQFWQAKMMMTKQAEAKSPSTTDENMMAAMNKQMLYFMPALTVFIGITLPGGLTLYWFITTILTALQQIYIFKHKENTKDEIVEGQIVK